MTQEIIIGGVSINELKKQRDAMKKEANAFISSQIEIGQETTREIISLLEDSEEVDIENLKALVNKADEALNNADLVAGVCGVEYYLDYATDWDRGDSLYYRIDNVYWDLEEQVTKVISPLRDTLGNMEYQSRQWHQSTC